MTNNELFFLILSTGSFIALGVALAITRFQYVRWLRESSSHASTRTPAGLSSAD